MNYEQILIDLCKSDERVMVITAENRAAIRNIPSIIGKQFLDVGISEMTMIGMSAGLALRGKIPIVHALATFLTLRAFEFIRTDVGIGHLPVKVVGAVAGFLSEANGPTHQAIEDVSIMRGIPKMNVFCPADEDDMLKGMKTVIESPDPFYIRYNNLKPMIEHSKFELGKAEIFGDGNDISILVYGMLFNEAYKVKTNLEKDGLKVRLINIRTPKPIDKDAVINAVKESKLVVTLEDHFITGGLFSIVSEIMALNKLSGNIFPVALEEKWFKPSLLNDVLEYEGFTADHLYKKIINKFEQIN